jgi:hypothetical protein
MPDPKRTRHARMKLRHSDTMADTFQSIHPRVIQLLNETTSSVHATANPGEMRAAAKYLSRTLAEFILRKEKGIPDAKYDSLDEVLWREDRAPQGDWEAVTGFPDGSPQQEIFKKQMGAPSAEKVAAARSLREAIRIDAMGVQTHAGGARHELANAIRHAWLICHEGHSQVSYGRQTNAYGDHTGPLHQFIKKVLELPGKRVSIYRVDEFHKEVREIDKHLHPDFYPPNKAP